MSGISDIAIHDLQMTIERGARDVCEAVTTETMREATMAGDLLAMALAKGARHAKHADGRPVHDGYVATSGFTMHLATGGSVPVSTGDEVLVGNGVVRVRDAHSGDVDALATSEIVRVTYHPDERHLW